MNGCVGLVALIFANQLAYGEAGRYCAINGAAPTREAVAALTNVAIAYWVYVGAQCLCCCSVMGYQVGQMGKLD